MAVARPGHPLRSFVDASACLGPLETFDPRAFKASANVPQELCNFVLALALVYNDCKDAMWAHVALSECQPEGPFRLTRAWGANNGVKFHVLRVMFGQVHELLTLLKDNKTQIEHPFFASIVARLDRKAKAAWDALVAVAFGHAARSRLAKDLSRLRQKVSFHYDAGELSEGYRKHFLSDRPVNDRAYVSRGLKAQDIRFYFADAAATGYLRHVVGSAPLKEILTGLSDIVGDINVALANIVDRYIERRGYAYRLEGEQ